MLVSTRIYTSKSNADYLVDDDEFGPVFGLFDCPDIKAEDRPEACCIKRTYGHNIVKYYVKRNPRKVFYNPKDKGHVSEQNKEIDGLKKWAFTEANKDVCKHYLRWLESGLIGDLNQARRNLIK